MTFTSATTRASGRLALPASPATVTWPKRVLVPGCCRETGGPQ
jgi:hypothetical protein